jgi:class 3 adenylate cyclase
MISCRTCGQANPEEARFCLKCGTALASAEGTTLETRKTVTVVFADISGSTELGERLDPEATRALLARYFAAMREVLEQHGGTVEKFIGDAVMAVFGVPTLHEDDALRAVRAASDMQARLAELNATAVAPDRRLEIHIGVNTGEVVAGAGGSQLLVTGDAVNVAARLEQAAPAGEILLGPTTEQLVRTAVTVEPVAPLAVKGKAAPLAAFRMLQVAAGRETRRERFAVPLVGRQRELHLLNGAFARATAERSVHLFTLLGEPGVGKSRLVHELVGNLGDQATVLRGRCLPYGEGITYWPIGEIVRSAAGIGDADARDIARSKLAAKIGDLSRADEIAGHVAAAIGLAGATPSRAEIFWAIRRFCEHLASERPLVLVLDDLQWAEPTLLELVGYLVESSQAPILLLVVARPDLLDRPGRWSGGGPNASTLRLEPLSAGESSELIGSLAGATVLPPTLRERVTSAAEGNPLFVEEFVAMLRDTGRLTEGNGNAVGERNLSELTVPPSITALLGARLDRLEPQARDAIGRAAIVGEAFGVAELRALTPVAERDTVQGLLRVLIQRGLVRPDPAVADKGTYRFGHLLVRDAAYTALPKQRRAELHERLATWLEATAGDRLAEFEEIIAHHLEQAFRYRVELLPEDEVARALAERAIGHLTAAAVHARNRDDLRAAGRLLERAVDLAPAGDRRRAVWMLDVGIASYQDVDLDRIERAWRRMREEAHAAGANDLASVADMEALVLRTHRDPSYPVADLATALAATEPIVEAANDPLVTADYWGMRAYASIARCQWREAAEDAERMAIAAADGHHVTLERGSRETLANALVWGPTPAAEVLERAEQFLRTMGPMESILLVLPLAQLGRIEEARLELAAGRASADELGLASLTPGSHHLGGMAELTAGNLVAAERELRAGTQMLEAAGETSNFSTAAGWLAYVLARLGRMDEAAEVAARAQGATAPGDLLSQTLWRMALALVEVARDDAGAGAKLAREAVELMRSTDMLDFRGDTHRTLADVLDAADQPGEAIAERREALRLYEAKGVLPKIAALRVQLASGSGTDSIGGSSRSAPENQ